MKPQTEGVLNLLRSRGAEGVTPALARHVVGTDRLAARVAELRQEGYVITTYDHRTPSGKHVAKYVLRWRHPLSELEQRYIHGDR